MQHGTKKKTGSLEVRLLTILGLLLTIFSAPAAGDWGQRIFVDSTIYWPHVKIVSRNDSIYAAADHWFIRSTDGGLTWGDIRYFTDGTFWLDNGLSLQGDTLVTFWGERDIGMDTWFYFSNDFGVTWQGPRMSGYFGQFDNVSVCRNGSEIYTAAIVSVGNGGEVWLFRSPDFGINWSGPESLYYYDTSSFPVIYSFYDRIYILSEVNYEDMIGHSTIKLLYSNVGGTEWYAHDSLTDFGSDWLPNMDAAPGGKIAFVYNDWWPDAPSEETSYVYICVSSDSGMTWTRPFDLSNSTRSKQPRVAMNADTIGVCWNNQPGFVFRRSHDLGASWQPVEVIDTAAWEGDIDFDGGKIHAVYQGRGALFYRRWEPEGQSTDDGPIPILFSLHAYPNPFNPTTVIEYALPHESAVTLDVFDIQGRRVVTLKEGAMPAGYHRAVWDAKEARSGVYFIRLRAGEFMKARKVILLK